MKIKLFMIFLVGLSQVALADNQYNFYFYGDGSDTGSAKPKIHQENVSLKSIEPQIEEEWAYVTLNKEDDTNCFIDGAKTQVDDTKVVRLVPGTHELLCIKPGFQDIKSSVKLRKGETATVNLKVGNKEGV